MRPGFVAFYSQHLQSGRGRNIAEKNRDKKKEDTQSHMTTHITALRHKTKRKTCRT